MDTSNLQETEITVTREWLEDQLRIDAEKLAANPDSMDDIVLAATPAGVDSDATWDHVAAMTDAQRAEFLVPIYTDACWLALHSLVADMCADFTAGGIVGERVGQAIEAVIRQRRADGTVPALPAVEAQQIAA